MTLKVTTDLITNAINQNTSASVADADYAMRTRTYSVYIPPQIAPAGTAVASQVATIAAQAEQYVFYMTGVAQGQRPVHLMNADLIPNASVTSDDTDYITYSVAQGDLAAGALATAIASKTSKTTGGTALTALTKVNLYNSTTGTAVAADQRIAFSLAKAGSGKGFGGGLLQFTITID